MFARPTTTKCSLCSERLSSSYPKPACKLCLAKIIKEESADFMKDIKTLKVDLREQTESPHKLSVTPGTSGSSAKKSPSCISDSDSANR